MMPLDLRGRSPEFHPNHEGGMFLTLLFVALALAAVAYVLVRGFELRRERRAG